MASKLKLASARRIMALAIRRKDYWYYSNGVYELESRTFANGRRELLNRHITGPMPQETIWKIINRPDQIDRDDENWQEIVIARLAAERFNTTHILEGVPRECGVSISAYLWSFVTWQNVGVAALATLAVAGTVTLIAVSPQAFVTTAHKLHKSCLSCFNPLLKFTTSKWGAISTDKLSAGVAKCLKLAGEAYVVTKVSHTIFDKMSQNCGPVSYRIWRAQMLDIYIQNQEDLIPERFQHDPVLRENICPISGLPIRVPCRSSTGHIFEEALIKAWIGQQIANGEDPVCPIEQTYLSFHGIEIDYELSDRIELRLLLLKAQEAL